MTKIRINELILKWWDTGIVDRAKLEALDLDDLLNAIGISIIDYENKVPVISDFDNTTYKTGTWWISFDVDIELEDQEDERLRSESLQESEAIGDV